MGQYIYLKKPTVCSSLCCAVNSKGSSSAQVCLLGRPSACPQHDRSMNAEGRLTPTRVTAIQNLKDATAQKGARMYSYFNSEQRQGSLPSPHFPKLQNPYLKENELITVMKQPNTSAEQYEPPERQFGKELPLLSS